MHVLPFTKERQPKTREYDVEAYLTDVVQATIVVFEHDLQRVFDEHGSTIPIDEGRMLADYAEARAAALQSLDEVLHAVTDELDLSGEIRRYFIGELQGHIDRFPGVAELPRRIIHNVKGVYAEPNEEEEAGGEYQRVA